jgi:glycosyltransferase involved in cell wall biosynthesis
MKAKIHIIAVAYQRFGELKVFVQAILNQSSKDWYLTILHDGPSDEFEQIMQEYLDIAPGMIEYLFTDVRHNDYGHSLRDIGLKNIQGDYVLLSNADNYFIPKAIEYLINATVETNADIVIFDMIHSHNCPGGRSLPPYSYFETAYERRSIDVSSAIVKKNLAEKVGFRDKSFDGDATYFEDILRQKTNIGLAKIPQVLLVHN